MCNVTSTFQEAHILISDKKWPVLLCARGSMNPKQLAKFDRTD